MEKQELKRKLVLFPILAFIVSIILFAFGSRLLTESQRSKVVQLDEGWSVFYGDVSLENATLSDLRLRDIQRGTVISISNRLPKKKLISPTIMFSSKMATIDVFIDGTNVYSYGWDDYGNHIMIPKNYHFIPIDDSSKEQDITISFKVSEDDSFSGLNPVYMGNTNELMKELLEFHRLPIFVGGFLCIYSWLLFSLAIYLYLTKRGALSMFFNSAVAMLLCLYTFTYNDIFCLLGTQDKLFSIIEYTTLYFMPYATSVLLYTTHPDVAHKRQSFFMSLNAIVPTIILMLHLFNIVHIHRFMIPFQIVTILEIIVMLPALFVGLNKSHKEKLASDTYTGVDADSYILLGFIILIGFALLEIAKYNFLRLSGYKGNFFTSINYLTLGMLYFIFCLFIYYFLHGIDNYNSIYIRHELEGLAYNDALTGLTNRGSCMQYFATLQDTYALVSFDLDNLKKVNDTYGHLEGDRMIKSFAELLKKAFPHADMIGRMGGDEFVVAIENPGPEACSKGIRALEKLIEEFNDTSDNFKLSASSGYAYSTERRMHKMEDVFMLADSRMYQMKEKHHNA